MLLEAARSPQALAVVLNDVLTPTSRSVVLRPAAQVEAARKQPRQHEQPAPAANRNGKQRRHRSSTAPPDPADPGANESLKRTNAAMKKMRKDSNGLS